MTPIFALWEHFTYTYLHFFEHFLAMILLCIGVEQLSFLLAKFAGKVIVFGYFRQSLFFRHECESILDEITSNFVWKKHKFLLQHQINKQKKYFVDEKSYSVV